MHTQFHPAPLCVHTQFHPGGSRILLKALGTDATALFQKHHAWVDADYLLSRRAVGWLQTAEPAPAAVSDLDLSQAAPTEEPAAN